MEKYYTDLLKVPAVKSTRNSDVVFHSLHHTSVTYKLKLSGGDIKVVQGDSGHARADMVTEENKITIPEGVDPELLMKVLGNPEMAALLKSLKM